MAVQISCDYKKFGRFLKAKREEAGLSQGDIAKAMGLTTPQYISNVERGIAKPSLRLLRSYRSLAKISKTQLIEFLVADYKSLLQKNL